MARKTNREEIDALIKATDQLRGRLEKTWQKVENLDAAIQSAREGRMKREAKQKKS